MEWKYILFDLDGTITDSAEGIQKSIQYALAAMHFPAPSEQQLWAFIGPPLLEGFQKISGMSYKEALQATEKYRERYRVKGLYENRLYPGMDKLFCALRQKGCRLAVATSKPEPYSLKILEYFGVSSYFDEIVGSTLDGMRAEKADIIKEVFRRMQLREEEKHQVIMVGDRKYDIIGAKTCGIASCGVYYGFAPENELEECSADYIVRTVEELSALLCNGK